MNKVVNILENLKYIFSDFNKVRGFRPCYRHLALIDKTSVLFLLLFIFKSFYSIDEEKHKNIDSLKLKEKELIENFELLT